MVVENHNEISKLEESNVRGEVNLEAAVINTLSELTKVRKKYTRVKEQLEELKGKSNDPIKIFEEAEQTIITQ